MGYVSLKHPVYIVFYIVQVPWNPKYAYIFQSLPLNFLLRFTTTVSLTDWR